MNLLWTVYRGHLVIADTFFSLIDQFYLSITDILKKFLLYSFKNEKMAFWRSPHSHHSASSTFLGPAPRTEKRREISSFENFQMSSFEKFQIIPKFQKFPTKLTNFEPFSEGSILGSIRGGSTLCRYQLSR